MERARTSERPRVGFIGLGDQGGPIAERLAGSAFPLAVWARRPDALQPFVARGVDLAADPASLARRSDVLCVCVRDDAGALEVSQTVLTGMAAGAILVIHSTIHPDTCRRIAALAQDRGVGLVDAPVSGGGAGARAGALTIMAGGSAAAIEACRPVFETYAALIVRLGEVGAGQLAKLVNNALMAANMAMADQAVEIGAGLGLDPLALGRVLGSSSGRSFAQEQRARLPTLSAFALGSALLRKDVRLLDEVGAAADTDVSGLVTPAASFLDKVDAACAEDAARAAGQQTPR